MQEGGSVVEVSPYGGEVFQHGNEYYGIVFVEQDGVANDLAFNWDSMLKISNGTRLTFDLSKLKISLSDRDEGDGLSQLASIQVDWGDGSRKESVQATSFAEWNKMTHFFSTDKRYEFNEELSNVDESQSVVINDENWELHPCVVFTLYNAKRECVTLKVYYYVYYPSFSEIVDDMELLDARICNDGTVSYKMVFINKAGERSIHLLQSGDEMKWENYDEVRRFNVIEEHAQDDLLVTDDQNVWMW